MIYDINSWAYQKYMRWNLGVNKNTVSNDLGAVISGSFWSGNAD